MPAVMLSPSHGSLLLTSVSVKVTPTSVASMPVVSSRSPVSGAELGASGLQCGGSSSSSYSGGAQRDGGVRKLLVHADVVRLGFQPDKFPPGVLTVKNVVQDEWAFNCDMRRGDELLELGGVPVLQMTRAVFEQAMKKRPLEVVVRDGQSKSYPSQDRTPINNGSPSSFLSGPLIKMVPPTSWSGSIHESWNGSPSSATSPKSVTNGSPVLRRDGSKVESITSVALSSRSPAKVSNLEVTAPTKGSALEVTAATNESSVVSPDGAQAYYLPFLIRGKPVLFWQDGDRYRYDASSLGMSFPLSYRRSMSMEDKDDALVAEDGGQVEGVMQETADGSKWLKVQALQEYAVYYLPIQIKGKPVIFHQEGDCYLYAAGSLGMSYPMSYRNSMNLDDKDDFMVAEDQSIVEGAVVTDADGNEWLQVSSLQVKPASLLDHLATVSRDLQSPGDLRSPLPTSVSPGLSENPEQQLFDSWKTEIEDMEVHQRQASDLRSPLPTRVSPGLSENPGQQLFDSWKVEIEDPVDPETERLQRIHAVAGAVPIPTSSPTSPTPKAVHPPRVPSVSAASSPTSPATQPTVTRLRAKSGPRSKASGGARVEAGADASLQAVQIETSMTLEPKDAPTAQEKVDSKKTRKKKPSVVVQSAAIRWEGSRHQSSSSVAQGSSDESPSSVAQGSGSPTRFLSGIASQGVPRSGNPQEQSPSSFSPAVQRSASASPASQASPASPVSPAPPAPGMPSSSVISGNSSPPLPLNPAPPLSTNGASGSPSFRSIKVPLQSSSTTLSPTVVRQSSSSANQSPQDQTTPIKSPMPVRASAAYGNATSPVSQASPASTVISRVEASTYFSSTGSFNGFDSVSPATVRARRHTEGSLSSNMVPAMYGVGQLTNADPTGLEPSSPKLGPVRPGSATLRVGSIGSFGGFGGSVNVTPGGRPVHIMMGASTLQGAKQSFPRWVNQDTHLVLQMNRGRTLVAVFDGHGEAGEHAAAQSRDYFAQAAPRMAMADQLNPTEFFRELYTRCHESMMRSGICGLSGATASTVLIDTIAGTLSIAHVGDSTVIVSQGNRVLFTSNDHKLDLEVDRIRIRAAGGEIRADQPGGPLVRVCQPGQWWPGLAMSRSLGDGEAHRLGVLAEPDIVNNVPFEPGMILTVASDGIWDMVEKNVAASLVSQRFDDPATASRQLAVEARGRYLPGRDIDDITAVIVCAHAKEESGY